MIPLKSDGIQRCKDFCGRQCCGGHFASRFPQRFAARGVYVWDSEGNRYLDFSGSAAVNFIGHGVPAIAAAMAEQASALEFVHTSQFTTPMAEEYAKELIDICRREFPSMAQCISPAEVRNLRNCVQTGTAVPGGDRRGETLQNFQPLTELSRFDSGSAVSFG